MTGEFGRVLLLVSRALLAPVVLLLLAFLVVALMHTGGFVAEALTRWRRWPVFGRFVTRLRRGELSPMASDEVPAGFGLPQAALSEYRTAPGHADKLLDDLHLRVDRLLGRLHLGIRLGPMLGLVGTLIPLGPALKALAGGDVKALSDELVVAFSAPVVGMLVGGMCFTMYAFRQRWYAQDLSDIEFLLDHLEGRSGERCDIRGAEGFDRSGLTRTTPCRASPTSSTSACSSPSASSSR